MRACGRVRGLSRASRNPPTAPTASTTTTLDAPDNDIRVSLRTDLSGIVGGDHGVCEEGSRVE